MRQAARTHGRAFTLIELLVVLAIVALLATLAMPRYFHSITHSKEVALKQNLATVRDTIDKFKADTGRYPDSLDELVARHYLATLPRDPITGAADTWRLDAPDAASAPATGIADIHSGAPGLSMDGQAYSQW